MSTYIPLSSSVHAGKSWVKPDNLGYCAQWDAVPLAIQEMQHIMPVAPLAFRRVVAAANDDERYELVALLSPLPGKNLYLKHDQSWVAGYIPAWIRMYPFRPVTSTPDGKTLMCIAQDAIKDSDAKGVALFDSKGQPSKPLETMLDVVGKFAQSQAVTQHAVDALHKLGLITEWPLQLKDSTGEVRAAKGIYHLDGKALTALAGDELEKLNKCGGLQIAYAQLLSEQRSAHFSRLIMASNAAEQVRQQGAIEDVETLFNKADDTLKFDF